MQHADMFRLARRPAVALIAMLALSPSAQAGSITIPWNLNFSFVAGEETRVTDADVHSGTIELRPFDTAHEISTRLNASCCGFLDIAGIDVRAGLRFPTQARNSYQVSLPYEVTLTAPDHARAGAPVTITPTIRFNGTPTLTTRSDLSFGTEAFVRGDAHVAFFSGDINADGRLPDVVPLGGGSQITFGGSGSYTASDTTAQAVSAGPFARTTAFLPNQFVAVPQDRFQGQQLQTEGRINAQRVEVNLLDILERVPVIGSAAAVANTVLDLDLEAGIDLIDRSTFTAGAMYARYSGDDFATIGTATINALGTSGFTVPIPASATGTYDLDFFGLGLGFGLLQQAFLEPELRLVLDVIDPLGEWQLLRAGIGDSWLVGLQTSRFQFEELFSFPNFPTFIPEELRTLSFILDGPVPPPPTMTDPGLPLGDGTPTEPASPFGTSASLPGTAPTEGTVVPLAVTEPASAALIVGGLLAFGCARRRGTPSLSRARYGIQQF